MDPAVTLGLISNFVFQVSDTFIRASSTVYDNFESVILASICVNIYFVAK